MELQHIATTDTSTEYGQQLDAALASELDTFAQDAVKAYAASAEAFAARLLTHGAADTLRWKADGLLSDELAQEVAAMVTAGLAKRTAGEITSMQVWAHIERTLQHEIERGVTSQSSGLFTNDVAKARAVAAVNALRQGFGLSSRIFSAHFQAQRTVARTEYDAVHAAEHAHQQLRLAQDRMRSDQRKRDAQPAIDEAAATLATARAALTYRLQEAGAPER